MSQNISIDVPIFIINFFAYVPTEEQEMQICTLSCQLILVEIVQLAQRSHPLVAQMNILWLNSSSLPNPTLTMKLQIKGASTLDPKYLNFFGKKQLKTINSR